MGRSRWPSLDALRGRARAAARLAARPDLDTTFEVLRRNQAALALALAEAHRHAESDPWEGPVRSRLCTQALCSTPTYRAWCERMGQQPRWHRKQWEWVFIADSLARSGVLQPGRRGVGFGVGREPLASLMAAAGCDVLATDLDRSDPRAAGWADTAQHAATAGPLHDPAVCDLETFTARVSWRAVDMTAVPGDLRGFDFCWSSCALEHLGSTQAGLDFVDRSLEVLRPGGVAVHTTELRLDDRRPGVTDGPTVLYDRADLEAAAARWRRAGHEVAELVLDQGDGVLDWYVDVPPFVLEEPSLRVLLAGHPCTSVGLVIRRASA